jgi:hypothetical protein
MMDSEGRIESTEAGRLARLRMLLTEAEERIADQSELGRHLAIVMVDGVGELAIGLCLFRLSIPPSEKETVPTMLDRLLKKLGRPEVPGLQGFRELHRVRNLVQHEGILPANDQLPRWFEDTDRMIRHLVRISFGAELNAVVSAEGVSDPPIRRLLTDGERSLEDRDYLSSMESSWRALEFARRRLRRHTGLAVTTAGRPAKPGTPDVEELRTQLQTLSEQWELSLFTADPGEWMWFEQRYKDAVGGLLPDEADSRRAFVFVLDWILRAEAYIERHGPERWQLWQQQSAPVTGVPGGPHIRDAWKQRDFPDQSLWEWGFQLTDVPAGTIPDFSWGVQAAHEASSHTVIDHAYLDPRGRLFLRSPEATSARDLMDAARALIADAKRQMTQRFLDDRRAEAADEALLAPFLAALEKTGCGVKEAVVRNDPSSATATRGHEPPVWIRVEGMPDTGTSSFPRFLRELFDSYLPSEDIDDCSLGFDDVTIPSDWPPDEVAAWLHAARQQNAEWESEEEASRIARTKREEATVNEVRSLIVSD